MDGALVTPEGQIEDPQDNSYDAMATAGGKTLDNYFTIYVRLARRDDAV